MIKIKLSDKWYLLSDRHNWILGEVRGQQLKHRSFHTDLNSVFEAFLGMSLRESQVSSFKGLLDRQNALLYHLNQAITPLNIQIETKTRVSNEGDKISN